VVFVVSVALLVVVISHIWTHEKHIEDLEGAPKPA